MDLSGKVALVTGAATGLGRALAEQLLICGAKVSICDLDSDAGEVTSAELTKRFGADKVLFCHCDVTEGMEFEGNLSDQGLDRKTFFSLLGISFLQRRLKPLWPSSTTSTLWLTMQR